MIWHIGSVCELCGCIIVKEVYGRNTIEFFKSQKTFFSERVESREFFFIKIKGNGICEKLQKNMKAHYFSCQNSFTLQNSIMRFVKKSKVNNRSLYDSDCDLEMYLL